MSVLSSIVIVWAVLVVVATVGSDFVVVLIPAMMHISDAAIVTIELVVVVLELQATQGLSGVWAVALDVAGLTTIEADVVGMVRVEYGDVQVCGFERGLVVQDPLREVFVGHRGGFLLT